jgi:glycopeptide antibiotics resistance protein
MKTFKMDVHFYNNDMNLLPLAWIILAAALVIIWFRTRNLWHLFFAAIFGVYLLFAIAVTFFPMWQTTQTATSLKAMLRNRNINLVPFYYPYSVIPEFIWLRIFQNTLLTVPFGFGVSFVVRLKPRHFLWLVPAIGFGIGLTQFILMVLVLVTRIIDIDDVILNSLGVLIGYLLFRIFAWLYLRITHRIGFPRSGLSGYVYDVAVRASGPPEERLPEPAVP